MLRFLLMGLLALSGVAAAEGRTYVGLGIGQSSTDFGSIGELNDGSLSSISDDESDTALAFFIGHRFNPNIAIRGGMQDLGEFSSSAVSDGSVFWPAGELSAAAQVDGFFVDVRAGGMANDSLYLFGKLGLLSWDIEYDAVIGGMTFTDSDSGQDPFFGLGAELTVGSNAAIGLEFSRFSVGDPDEDVDLIGLTGTLFF